jgi:putative ABC transport system permease protein
LREGFPDFYLPVQLPASLDNAERIVWLPFWVGLAAAALAAVTLAHAVAVTVRRQRRDLAVCRVVGFTREQTYATIGTEALIVGVAACLPGALVGVVAARWAWRLVADGLGVGATGPVVPPWLLASGALAVLVVTGLVAVGPARRAASAQAARILRAE